MPKATASSSDSEDVKPYTQPSPKKTKTTAKKWTDEDKHKLLMGVIESAKLDWASIASKFEGRSQTREFGFLFERVGLRILAYFGD